jgi:threonine dehydratase
MTSSSEKTMIGIHDVENARARIGSSIYLSPCAHSETFSKLTGSKVFFKLENLQMTGSFKERGALNKILTLTAEERGRGVIAASAGNHAQGVSYHATRQGLKAEICMPMTTPLIKVTATRNYGAEVVLAGANYDEAYEEALRRRAERGLTLIHPFDDDAVIAGQGTIGLELIEQNPYLDAVVVPIGGGGLIGGIACAMKETNPKIKVFGVQTAKLPSMRVAVQSGAPTTIPAAVTIADGIAVRRAGERTLPLVQRYVDDIVTVDEEEIANAILQLLEREKTVAEGAGAAAAAALLHHKLDLPGKKVAVLVCGGNIDVNFLSRIIERGLVKDGRLVRLRLKVPDHPGALHRLTGVIARFRANVNEIAHDRTYFGVNLGDTVLDITLETRGAGHIEELLAGLTAEGYTHERVV